MPKLLLWSQHIRSGDWKQKQDGNYVFTEKWLILSFLRTLVRQLNYWFVYCRISLDSPQISSFVWESIHLLLFSLWSMTHLRVHSITPLLQPPIQPTRHKPEFFLMNQIKTTTLPDIMNLYLLPVQFLWNRLYWIVFFFFFKYIFMEV